MDAMIAAMGEVFIWEPDFPSNRLNSYNKHSYETGGHDE